MTLFQPTRLMLVTTEESMAPKIQGSPHMPATLINKLTNLALASQWNLSSSVQRWGIPKGLPGPGWRRKVALNERVESKIGD